MDRSAKPHWRNGKLTKAANPSFAGAVTPVHSLWFRPAGRELPRYSCKDRYPRLAQAYSKELPFTRARHINGIQNSYRYHIERTPQGTPG
jgi:hypothetical protein